MRPTWRHWAMTALVLVGMAGCCEQMRGGGGGGETRPSPTASGGSPTHPSPYDAPSPDNTVPLNP